ncbi:MAG: acyl-CoA dehydrogenase [Chloroflexi bacterium]|nr:MAG: acyl-CoA dehydrogenase [Chloroflexota bacterium]
MAATAVKPLADRLDELRDWLARETPRDLPYDLDARFPRLVEWQRKLYDAGWLGYGWPAEFGGNGGGPTDKVILSVELARAAAPVPAGTIGLEVIGPTLTRFGTDAQRRRFLPPMLRGDEIWSQGFSEPEAGSDLASLRTRAEKVEGGYIVSGRKTWTSWGQFARWCGVLARTDPDVPKHKGISLLMVDMESEGAQTFPLVQMTGDAEFTETLFERVFVPDENVVGQPGDGWNLALDILAHERGPLVVRRQVEIAVGFEGIVENARRLVAAGVLADDARLRERVGRAWAQLRMLEAYAAGLMGHLVHGDLGPEASIGKRLVTEVEQAVFELGFDILGASRGLAEDAVPGMNADKWTRDYLYSRAASIYGGAAEIQRGIIAQRVLGLPRA